MDFKVDSTPGKTLGTQIAVYVLCALVSASIALSYGRFAVLLHRLRRDQSAAAQAKPAAQPQAHVQQPQAAQVQAQAATPVIAVDPAAHYEGNFAAEVQDITGQWQAKGFTGWQPVALDAASLDEYHSDRMAALEQAKAGGWQAAATAHWQGQQSVPTLAGRYFLERATASNWPAPGSLALELSPTEADPAAKAGPWRAVVFLASPSGAREAVQYSGMLAYAPHAAREIILGRDGVRAVPVARQSLGTDGKSFYCVVAGRASVRVAGTDVVQTIDPAAPSAQATAAPIPALAADPHAAWQATHDAYVVDVRARAAMATTPEQKGAIQREIAEWKRQHPEPARATDPNQIVIH